MTCPFYSPSGPVLQFDGNLIVPLSESTVTKFCVHCIPHILVLAECYTSLAWTIWFRRNSTKNGTVSWNYFQIQWNNDAFLSFSIINSLHYYVQQWINIDSGGNSAFSVTSIFQINSNTSRTSFKSKFPNPIKKITVSEWTACTVDSTHCKVYLYSYYQAWHDKWPHQNRVILPSRMRKSAFRGSDQGKGISWFVCTALCTWSGWELASRIHFICLPTHTACYCFCCTVCYC